LDAQRPSLPDPQLLFPHFDINLLTVIAHTEQRQFDIGTWVRNLRPAHSTHGDGDPDIVNGLTANDR